VVVWPGCGDLLGLDAESTCRDLKELRRGAVHSSTPHYRTTIAAEVSNWDTGAHFDAKEARRLDRFSEFFIVAARQAIAQAGLDFASDEEAAARSGVMVGAGFGGMGSFIEEISTLLERGRSGEPPECSGHSQYGCGAGVDHSSHRAVCVITACSASTIVGDAAELIRRCRYHRRVAPGITTLASPPSRARRTTNSDVPGHRPFDANKWLRHGRGRLSRFGEPDTRPRSGRRAIGRGDRLWHVS
jgi:3-oxoacyl-[acyl-carrier-protein] synthase II